MDNSVQLRWIAEAEARSVREIARLQQAELFPCNCAMRWRPTVGSRLSWLRRLIMHLMRDSSTDRDTSAY